jgi:hypothetical protein
MATREQIQGILFRMSHLPSAPLLEGKEQARSVIETYWSVLGHLPEDLLNAASLDYLSSATFFPAPGDLYGKAMDLQMASFGIPTPAEAWGHVLNCRRHKPTVLCLEGGRLCCAIDGKSGVEYWNALDAYHAHVDQCSTCAPGGLYEDYGHPIVAETVRLLGGRDALFTDNMAADRKQFIDAYRERVQKEIQNFARVPAVKSYVEQQSRARIDSGISTVTKRLAVNNDRR